MIVWLYHNLFIHVPFDDNLIYSHFGTIINKTAVSISDIGFLDRCMFLFRVKT